MISVVLSGGAGTRLWPVSRKKLPKQFAPLFAQPLFAQTVRRLASLGEVRVCTGQGMRALTERAINTQELPVGPCYYEPVARNTAPAVAFVCKALVLDGKGKEVVGIFPSDHWIGKPEVFQKVVALAETEAQKGALVTLGIQPSYPATGFGYIESVSYTHLTLPTKA